MTAASRSIALQRPLVSISTVSVILGVDEDTALGLIETGKLRWAMDVSRPGAHRRLIRVSARSLVAAAEGISDNTSQEEMLASVLPSVKSSTVRARELALRMVVSSTHVHELIKAGCLRASKAARGPGGSPAV